jgi:hypothetical protein
MKGKARDFRILLIGGKFQDTLYRLRRTDITAGHISLDFVGFHDFQSSLIPPFVNVLVDIFDSFNRGANLHIDIGDGGCCTQVELMGWPRPI